MEMRIKCSSQQTVQITDMFRIHIYLPFNSFSIYGVQGNVLSRYWHKNQDITKINFILVGMRKKM